MNQGVRCMTATKAVYRPSGVVLPSRAENIWRYYALFFCSGFPALLYQIVWQRALFTIYGINIQSVTVIVTVFMLGLGVGSLAGGRLSTVQGVNVLRAFGIIELSIGVFGFFSLPVFHFVARFTAGTSTAVIGIITFLLLLIPTLLMGSTLPLLVAHIVRRTTNVGESVGALYAVNTFGSGVACLVAAAFLMRVLGESGSVRLAACVNCIVGAIAVFLTYRKRSVTQPTTTQTIAAREAHRTLTMWIGMLMSGAAGFIALAYEILWFHIYSFTSGGKASCFARLLAFYLFGVAYGSLAVRDVCRQKLKSDLPRTLRAASIIVAMAAIAAFLVAPAVVFAVSSSHIPYDLTFTFVAIAAALLGAAFPMLSHATIDPNEQTGKKLSYLYLSNIIGSALGSFLIGFVALDHLSTAGISVVLLGLGFSFAVTLALLARPLPVITAVAAPFAFCVLLALSSHVLFSTMFERLMIKSNYRPGMVFRNLVENRSGVIAVDTNERVYGGGVYDGQFNIDPVNGSNGIFRAYAIAAFHPNLQHALVIGLSSGSWAQILANHPSVQDVTIVEINPGYLQLIQQRPIVSSLLQNPKIHIVIDDGRRWLVSHPDRRFDFILMNTTFNWRANTTNLLSVEFLQLARCHLNPEGILYYNTTRSGEVQLTGATVFPYALRVANFLAVSDSPIVFDQQRCRTTLSAYRIDGQSVFDLNNPAYKARLDQFCSLPLVNQEGVETVLQMAIEDRSSMLNRLKGPRLITDDNMGTEWR